MVFRRRRIVWWSEALDVGEPGLLRRLHTISGRAPYQGLERVEFSDSHATIGAVVRSHGSWSIAQR